MIGRERSRRPFDFFNSHARPSPPRSFLSRAGSRRQSHLRSIELDTRKNDRRNGKKSAHERERQSQSPPALSAFKTVAFSPFCRFSSFSPPPSDIAPPPPSSSPPAPPPRNLERKRKTTQKSVAQFWAAAAWWTSRGGSLSPAATAPAALLAGIVLVALGQVLNAAVYATIGGDGVYYGVRLGRTVPWVHGFPFRLLATGGKPGTGVRVPHPQYLGSAATAWGLLLAFSGAAPAGATVLVGYWTALYVLTALQEDYL